VAHGQRHDVLQRLRVIAELQGRGKSTLVLFGCLLSGREFCVKGKFVDNAIKTAKKANEISLIC